MLKKNQNGIPEEITEKKFDVKVKLTALKNTNFTFRVNFELNSSVLVKAAIILRSFVKDINTRIGTERKINNDYMRLLFF